MGFSLNKEEFRDTWALTETAMRYNKYIPDLPSDISLRKSEKILLRHENEKKRVYNRRVVEIEQAVPYLLV